MTASDLMRRRQVRAHVLLGLGLVGVPAVITACGVLLDGLRHAGSPVNWRSAFVGGALAVVGLNWPTAATNGRPAARNRPHRAG
ncbi:MAG: hypothetical protein ACRDQB_13010, partial [Thermocrispum sp.]